MIKIFLDIDGVVSANGVLPDNEFITIPSSYSTFTIRNEVRDWLVNISKNDNVIIEWSSQQQLESNDINASLNIPDFNVIFFDEDILEEGWFKTYKYVQLVEENSDYICIIIDDDFTPEAITRLAQYDNVFMIKPNGDYGLTNSQIRTINEVVNHR